MKTLDLSGEPDLPVPVEVLRRLHLRATELGVEILVVGAAARDLVVHAPAHQRPQRATLDVDVAVAVDRAGFDRFTCGLQRIAGSEHKFSVLGVEVDVVPFGLIEVDRHVDLNDGHRLDVNGIAEAARDPVQVALPGGLRVRVASLPAQAALKVLAWRDRHHTNPKDAVDLRGILDAAALSPHDEDVWKNSEALEFADYDISVAAAFHTGRRAAEPFSRGDGEQVLAVLDDPAFADRLAATMGHPGEELIHAFAEGLRSGL